MNPVITILFFSVMLFSCDGKTQTDENSLKIERPKSVSEDETLINLGFIDNPVYYWVKPVNIFDNKYEHILGLSFTAHDNLKTDTLYYETTNRENLEFFLEKPFQLTPYPGNNLMKIGNEENSTFIFNVLSSPNKYPSKNAPTEYIPTIKVHSSKVETLAETGINFEGSEFIVLTDETGKKRYRYKKIGACDIKSNLSYFNKSQSRIYYIQKNCYLELY